VAPGGGSTPATTTFPTSPPAWQPTTVIDGRERIEERIERDPIASGCFLDLDHGVEVSHESSSPQRPSPSIVVVAALAVVLIAVERLEVVRALPFRDGPAELGALLVGGTEVDAAPHARVDHLAAAIRGSGRRVQA